MGKCRIEIITSGGKDTVNIEGCRSVEKYTPDEITVELSGRKLSVCGKALNMPVLVNSNLCICGYVKTLELKPEAEKGAKK